ncbi:hypothetical protein WA158_007168 [Blastocystis sp. Blastoise]
MSTSYYLGKESGVVDNLFNYFNEDVDKSFDFIVTPLFHPKFRRDSEGISNKRDGPDLIFQNSVWSKNIVGQISEWIRLDSSNEIKRKSCELVFREEIEWANHLNIPAVLLPQLIYDKQSEVEGCINYASITNEMIQAYNNMEYWLPIRVQSPTDESEEEEEINCPAGDLVSWSYWSLFRTLCDNHDALRLALILTSDLPSPAVLDLLLGEDIAAVFIPLSLFVLDDKDIHIFLPAIESLQRHEKGYAPYIYDLNEIYKSRADPGKYSQYNDVVQIPLQPLMDNLSSSTYETFEVDAPKYQLYEAAMYAYFLSHSPIPLPAIPSRHSDTLYVMVVGAGRGPLVRACLRAAKRAQKIVHIYAIEKNPNAIITLRNMKESLGWGTIVDVIKTDMRQYTCPTKADLIISELLGSWGDNELSPECLAGTLPSTHEGTVYIPQQYTSYLQPIMSETIYNNVRHLSRYMSEDPLQRTYVVKTYTCTCLAPALPLFTFVHPEHNPESTFSQYKTLRFTATSTGLYEDVFMSIVPETHSTNMFSWFPLYIPIKTPIDVEEGDTIIVSVWRKTGNGKVWYEWCIVSPTITIIHNSNGKHQWIGL